MQTPLDVLKEIAATNPAYAIHSRTNPRHVEHSPGKSVHSLLAHGSKIVGVVTPAETWPTPQTDLLIVEQWYADGGVTNWGYCGKGHHPDKMPSDHFGPPDKKAASPLASREKDGHTLIDTPERLKSVLLEILDHPRMKAHIALAKEEADAAPLVTAAPKA